MFKDAINPTAAELEMWAYDASAEFPPEGEQDWDLCVASYYFLAQLIRFASDRNCPKREFFLDCLLTFVKGSLIRREYFPEMIKELSCISDQGPDDLICLAKHVRDCIEGREVFEYDRWCCVKHLCEKSGPIIAATRGEAATGCGNSKD